MSKQLIKNLVRESLSAVMAWKKLGLCLTGQCLHSAIHRLHRRLIHQVNGHRQRKAKGNAKCCYGPLPWLISNRRLEQPADKSRLGKPLHARLTLSLETARRQTRFGHWMQAPLRELVVRI